MIIATLEKEILPPLKLYEYYVIDVLSSATAFHKAWTAAKPAATKAQTNGSDFAALPDKELAAAFAKLCLSDKWDHLGERNGITVDLARAVEFVQKLGVKDAEDATARFAKILDIVNLPRYELWDEDHKAIIENTKNRLKYTRMAEDGPKMGEITPKCAAFSKQERPVLTFAHFYRSPLAEPLFTRLPASARTKHDPLALILANNGWIWDADPLVDFASSSSRTYLRRELIVWGDCVKLRYGTGPAANPWLWSHMTAYVELLAGMFDGFRLDNSHSTPVHVGEILLDKARVVQPNLYVCAELFTGSQELDLHFVCRLGINSLIREAMSAFAVHFCEPS